MGGNPWITSDDPASALAAPPQPVAEAEQEVDQPEWTGAERPQAGVPAIDQADRLGRVDVPPSDTLWVVGVHGGAGETTVAGWLDAELGEGGSARPTCRRWPVAGRGRTRAVLVARTTSAGLAAARYAATEWASSEVPVDVLALILVQDAPGRLPQQLRDECKQLSGAVPRTWKMPYFPQLRLEPNPGQTDAPIGARRVIRSISAHLHKETK